MPESTLGLDIGHASIKAVKVIAGLKGYRVTSCAHVDIDPKDGVEATLAAFLQDMSLTGSGCNASYRTDRVSFRNLTMPFKDRKKISQTIGFELEPMLPFPVETIATDYVMAANGTETRVLSASVQEAALEQYLGQLANLRLDPDVIDIDSVATAIQLSKDRTDTSKILFVDIGSRTSSAVLLIDGAVVLVRSFSFGGDMLTEAIAEAEKIGKPEAEVLKCQDKASKFLQIADPIIRSFCRSLGNTLHAFRYEAMREAVPEKLVLSGGGALFSGLDKILGEYFEQPVEVLDLAKYRELEFDPETSGDWNPPIMNGALALALREQKNRNGFNFRVGRFQKAKKYEQLKTEARRVAIYAGVILLALLGRYFADYYVLKKQNDHIQSQVNAVFKETFPDVQRIVDPVHQMKVKIREAKEALLFPAESVVQRATVDVLRDIGLRIPKTADVDPSSLVMDEQRIRLKGLTDTFNTVDEIKNGLEKSSYLKNVSIASAQLDSKTNQIRFEIVMEHK
jgi:general secretion pathway protein L